MDSFGGLFKFFYNIIPGTLFLFGLNALHIPILIYFPKTDVERIFWFIVIGIFLGFIGQGIMKQIKKYLRINKQIFTEVKSENAKTEIYNAALNNLTTKIPALKTGDLAQLFYSMDNYLRNKDIMYIINDFSEKAAFWGNIFLASVILFAVALYNYNIIASPLFVLICFSFCLFYQYTYAERDSILKTYAQI